MSDDPLRAEFEKMWTEVRTAFAEFRLDDALKYLQVPPGSPRPTREQAKQVADFLPDIRKCTFVRLSREKDRACYCALLGSHEAVVFRFDKTPAGWKIAPPPNSSSSYSDEGLSEAQARALLDTEPTLKLFP